MRSISQGRLEAERWSVFLYWTLHSHSKQWPAPQWFITRAVLWSLTFSAYTLALKTGLSLSINARQGDPFKIWNAYLITGWGKGRAGSEVAASVALRFAGHPGCRGAGNVWLGIPRGAEMLGFESRLPCLATESPRVASQPLRARSSTQFCRHHCAAGKTWQFLCILKAVFVSCRRLWNGIPEGSHLHLGAFQTGTVSLSG